MAERMVISIDAPDTGEAMLSVQDAFEQIIDLFELAAYTDDGTKEDDVIWKLVTVSMQSPLRVVAEAVGKVEDIDISTKARRQRDSLANNLDALRQGSYPVAWAHGRAKESARRVARRSRRAVGLTRIASDPIAPPQIEVLSSQFEAVLVQEAEATAARARKPEHGAIEGIIREVGTLYGKPAIRVEERLSGREIWCVIPNDDALGLISDHAAFSDVWKSKRVKIPGILEFDTNGDLVKVIATDISRVASTYVSEDAIADRDFTARLSVKEYVDRLHEGTIG